MSKQLCQCGATPRWHVVRGTVRGRRRPPLRERLVCPMCGNQTGPHAGRERASEEWEAAARFGQAGVKGLGCRLSAVGCGKEASV